MLLIHHLFYYSKCLLDSQYMYQFSAFSDDAGEEYKDPIIDFVSNEYMNILETAQFNTVYDSEQQMDIVGSKGDSELGSLEVAQWWSMDETKNTGSWDSTWRSITQNNKLNGFHQITALSETSVNAHFQGLWNSGKATPNSDDRIVYSWELPDGNFSATFTQPVVRLRKDKYCVLYLQLQEGYVTIERRFPRKYVWPRMTE